MKNLSTNHRKVLSDRLPDTEDDKYLVRLLKSTCPKLGISIHDRTIGNIVNGNDLTKDTVGKLLRVLESFDETSDLANESWLNDPLARPPKNGPTIAASVDPRLDQYSLFQHEIDRLKGLYVIYRRHSSVGVDPKISSILIRELLLVKGGGAESTDAYFVTKQGSVYKGRGLRYKDIWKFDFFRVRRKAMVVSRSIKLQADSPAIKRQMMGGVMLRTTDTDTEASACDLLAMKLPLNPEAPDIGEKIVATYEDKGVLFPSREQAPPTILKKNQMSEVEKVVYQRLTGTIVAPSDVSGISLEEVHQALPLEGLSK